MKKNVFYLYAITIVLLSSMEKVQAQIPRSISFQGVLADAQGNLVPDGNHQLQIVLWDQATFGNQVFIENQTVPVVKGIFNFIIGSVNIIPTTLTFDRAYFLGVSVDGGQELTPRTALTSVPYALRAVHANTADALAPNATGVVTKVNGQDGDFSLIGGG